MKTTTFPHKLQIRINKRIFAPPLRQMTWAVTHKTLLAKESTTTSATTNFSRYSKKNEFVPEMEQ